MCHYIIGGESSASGETSPTLKLLVGISCDTFSFQQDSDIFEFFDFGKGMRFFQVRAKDFASLFADSELMSLTFRRRGA